MKIKNDKKRQRREAQARWAAKKKSMGEQKMHFCPTREQRTWIVSESKARGISQEAVIRQALGDIVAKGKSRSAEVVPTTKASNRPEADQVSDEKFQRIIAPLDIKKLIRIRKRLTTEVGRMRKLLPPDHSDFKGEGGRGKDKVSRGVHLLLKPGVKKKDLLSNKSETVKAQILNWINLGLKIAATFGAEREERFRLLVARIIPKSIE